MAAGGEAEACTVVSSETEGGVIDTVTSIGSKLSAGEAVLESLRKLQAVPMTFRVLEATKIGRAVNVLRKDASSDDEARGIATALYSRWKALADEHFRSSRSQSSPPVSAPTPSPEAPNPKVAATTTKNVVRPAVPVKAGSASGSCARTRSREEAAPPKTTSSIDAAATVKKNQTSAPPHDATRKKVEQPAPAIIRKPVAAVPKPAAPAPKPTGGSNKEASAPSAAAAPPKSSRNMKIIIKRPASLAATAKLPPPAEPLSGSSASRKRKDPPTTNTSTIDEARLAVVKRRLQERYKEAADAKQKRRIQFTDVPGKAAQRRRAAPSSRV